MNQHHDEKVKYLLVGPEQLSGVSRCRVEPRDAGS